MILITVVTVNKVCPSVYRHLFSAFYWPLLMDATSHAESVKAVQLYCCTMIEQHDLYYSQHSEDV